MPTEPPPTPWIVQRTRQGSWYQADAREAARAVLCGLRVTLGTDSLPKRCKPGKPATFAPEHPERGPNGRGLCRWCHKEVPKRRRKWCSDLCVHEYKAINDWNYVRASVFDRDEGVCVSCGIDAPKAQAKWIRIWFSLKTSDRVWPKCPAMINSTLREIGWNTDLFRDFWEVDHIVARADGGGNELTNLRTLCVVCHKDRSAKQAATWAANRRKPKGIKAARARVRRRAVKRR